MPNPYYDNSDPGARLVSGTTARASEVEAKFDAVQAAFDLAHADIEDITTQLEDDIAAAVAASATAVTKASEASASASTASTAAGTATAAASSATSSASSASSSAAAASGSATLASQWADSPTQVTTGRYSAKYWADQAAAIVAAPVTSVAGKTGAVTLVKDDVGLGNVDNTSDANKPVSTATQAAFGYTTTTTATSKTLANRERCTVTAAGQTITLPASPSAGWEVSISVGSFVNTIVARNGQNIMGLAENMTVDSQNVTVTLFFVDATRGWRII